MSNSSQPDLMSSTEQKVFSEPCPHMHQHIPHRPAGACGWASRQPPLQCFAGDRSVRAQSLGSDRRQQGSQRAGQQAAAKWGSHPPGHPGGHLRRRRVPVAAPGRQRCEASVPWPRAALPLGPRAVLLNAPVQMINVAHVIEPGGVGHCTLLGPAGLRQVCRCLCAKAEQGARHARHGGVL